jgi:hypothetical protein
MVLIRDDAQVEGRFGHLEVVEILMQDRCTDCAKHTIGLEIILDTPDGTPRRRESCRILF